MSRHRAAAVSFPRLFALPPPSPDGRNHALPPPPPALNHRPAAWVHVRGREITVEVQAETALELVDRALLAGLLQAGLGAEKEGVRMADAVLPPICYGKIRVSPQADREAGLKRLTAARAAAAAVLIEGGCDLIR